MKEYNSNYLGMVIHNNDPEYRGRVQVFIPHIMPALYDGWNKEGKDIQISCVGSNMESSLGDDIVNKLKLILPWAEAASPIIGPSAPGGVVGSGGSNQFVQSPTSTPTASTGTEEGENGKLGVNSLKSIGNGHKLRPDAADAYLSMVQAAQADGIKWSVTDSYRTYEAQVRVAQQKGLYSDGGLAAKPGTSNHGWGTAVDLAEGANIRGTPQNDWLQINAGKFGFKTIPREPWHWEFKNSGSTQEQTTTAASAAPPASNPTAAPDANPQTGAPINGMTYNPGAGTVAGTTSGGGTATTGNAELASDRNRHLGAELTANKELLLSRIQATLENEVGGYNAASSQAIIETMVNRAYFENRTLENVVTDGAYYTETYNKTAAPSELTRAAFEKVMSGGNMTNLATDAGFNLPNTSRAIKNGDPKGLFITGMQSKNYKIQGVIDLQTGKEVTDQSILRDLYTNGERKGRYEFFVRQSRGKYTPDKIGEYAQQNGITSDGFTTDLDPNLSGAGGAPSVIGNTYPHGRPHQMNTNDMANGLFAFPAVGAMVWVFFREGNPLYPVYFAASYSSSEWQRAYNGASLNSTGTNTGNPEPHKLSSRTAMNLGGGNSITNISQQDTQDQLNSYSALCVQHNSGSGLTFRDGVTEQYDKNDYFKQTDGNLWNVTHGAKETWISGPSNSNQIGNSTEFYGKWDQEAMEASKKLADMCFEYNQKMKSQK